MKNKILVMYTLPALLLPIVFTALSAPAERPRPNILVFLVDDMGIGDMSAYRHFTKLDNSLQLHTPTFDKLAKQGLLFTDAHSVSSLCSPSRWGLLTGKHPWRRPDVGHILMHSKTNCFLVGEKTLSQRFRSAGYRTYGIGKWHMGLEIEGDKLVKGPLDFGFDRFFGVPHNPLVAGTWKFMSGRGFVFLDQNRQLVDDESKGIRFQCDLYSQIYLDQFRRFASEVVADGEHEGKPFFIYYTPNSNHTPYHCAEQIDGIPVKGCSRTLAGECTTNKLGPALVDHRASAKPKFKDSHNCLKRADMILENDVVLGRILEWLEQTDDPRFPGHKMKDNTLIVFSSDNGSDVRRHQAPSHGPLSGYKNTQFEGGHRVPLVVVWPGKVPAGQRSKLPVSLIDFYATFAEAAGIVLKKDEAQDSESLLQHWLNPVAEFTRTAPIITLGGKANPGIYDVEGGKRWVSIRDGYFKLTLEETDFSTGKAIPVGLYRLDKTLKENPDTNLLKQPEYAAQLRKMQDAFEKAVGDGYTRQVDQFPHN